ncbi:hypothetical protein WJX81_001445 [Elliptochloris bilobata]|uniref:KANL3/Tex30 alpha/beta hydrolase-like domain-containing protein n=1 Tax=Elliptochloris bilobata TaxID=381761 RepID=A0AAW1S174_9CHLO
MGARVAAEVAASDLAVLACVFFSYPLHPPGKQDRVRDTPLTSLKQPLLFVRGTRDAFSEDAEFQAVRARLESQRVEIHTLEGGDHSLKVPGGKAAAAAALADARAAAN